MRHPFRVLLASLALAALPALAGEDTYKIDPVHSEVSFKVGHLLAKVSGRFTKFEGTIKVDTADISKSSVEVVIDAASLTTDNESRDKHLKSPDFFDVAKYPTVTFKSTAVKEVAKGKLEVTGDFTLHGVTKRITFPITNAGTQPGMAPGSVVAGFVDGALSLNRSEYGIKFMPGIIGDTVAISLNAEAGKVAPSAKK
ncbi:polyisoprenoid-binding protein [Geothrix oryzae]|uniref:Polyisoprenoid-binding protein n=1 Tax=Geothrix oryzae TaxID=2927975 RepID=A0ABN6UTV3_9BACT|nr:YceI family protein [Geothrix oryzae]BDU68160.1 polyisoprenoid-binding protein [Geothrix oryzae]